MFLNAATQFVLVENVEIVRFQFVEQVQIFSEQVQLYVGSVFRHEDVRFGDRDWMFDGADRPSGQCQNCGGENCGHWDSFVVDEATSPHAGFRCGVFHDSGTPSEESSLGRKA